jgi:hypothetical protein
MDMCFTVPSCHTPILMSVHYIITKIQKIKSTLTADRVAVWRKYGTDSIASHLFPKGDEI